ncbi:MotA/TolQ/ExbB proton channel family protein [Pontiella sp.]|uniref:MotA/TolQ/ExbB proton channel family protein n=1 Tax=Pontiella sp. TaxID=2837462 RepID=UPI003568AEB0
MPYPENSPPTKTPVVLTVLGSILSLGPVLGFLGTVISMMLSFHAMGDGGMDKPEALASNIGFALTSTAVGILLFPLGVILLVFGIRGMIKQRKQTGT